MPNAIMHRLPDGRFRVTNAPDGWTNDGRDYPPPNPSDAIYEFQADAVRDYLERTTPHDPSDDISGPDDDGPDDDLAGWGSGGGRGR
jgi:hypothetical protein